MIVKRPLDELFKCGFNPTAFKMAENLLSNGHTECSRVKDKQ